MSSRAPTEEQQQQQQQQKGESAFENNDETLAERFARASALADSNAERAVLELRRVQEQVVHISLFSKNETLEDLSTGSIPFVALEHYLALAYMNLNTMSKTSQPPRPEMKQRLRNVIQACDLWTAFLHRLEKLELLQDVHEKRQYEDLMEVSSSATASTSSGGSGSSSSPTSTLSFSVDRTVKIAQFRVKQELEQKLQQLSAVRDRRQRLGIQSTQEMDGYDDESLARELAVASLNISKLQALEEWVSAVRELPMIQRMMQHEQQQAPSHLRHQPQNERNDTRTAPPLQLTQITMNGATGQLQVHNTNSREVLQSQVFQLGWNQPTMSLEELAEKEVAAAMQREERDAIAKEAQNDAPRRFEYLEKDGLEDNAHLVDASAPLDREWDDWKDENPRGSGNKRANVGDRNF